MRGVVSLAVALAIPFTILTTGSRFPHRDLILFVTFGVIIITLVGQGLMLPYVVRWLGLNRLGKKERKDEIRAELRARQAALQEVDKRLGESHQGRTICRAKRSSTCARAIKAACRYCRRT